MFLKMCTQMSQRKRQKRRRRKARWLCCPRSCLLDQVQWCTRVYFSDKTACSQGLLFCSFLLCKFAFQSAMQSIGDGSIGLELSEEVYTACFETLCQIFQILNSAAPWDLHFWMGLSPEFPDIHFCNVKIHAHSIFVWFRETMKKTCMSLNNWRRCQRLQRWKLVQASINSIMASLYIFVSSHPFAFPLHQAISLLLLWICWNSERPKLIGNFFSVILESRSRNKRLAEPTWAWEKAASERGRDFVAVRKIPKG